MNPDHFLKNNLKNDTKISYGTPQKKPKKKAIFFPPTHKYESILFPKNNSKNDMNTDPFLKTNSKNDLNFFYGTQKCSPLRALKTKISLPKQKFGNDITYHFLTNNSKNDMNQYHF